MKFRVINEFDGNETFEVEADNVNDAYCKALAELGWWVSKEGQEEIEEYSVPSDYLVV